MTTSNPLIEPTYAEFPPDDEGARHEQYGSSAVISQSYALASMHQFYLPNSATPSVSEKIGDAGVPISSINDLRQFDPLRTGVTQNDLALVKFPTQAAINTSQLLGIAVFRDAASISKYGKGATLDGFVFSDPVIIPGTTNAEVSHNNKRVIEDISGFPNGYSSTFNGEFFGVDAYPKGADPVVSGMSGGAVTISFNGTSFVAGIINGVSVINTSTLYGGTEYYYNFVGSGLTMAEYQTVIDAIYDGDPSLGKKGPKNLIFGKNGNDTFSGTIASENIVAGSGTTTVYASLGDDTYLGDKDQASKLSVSFSSDMAADAAEKDSIAKIGKIDAMLDVGYSYGELSADVRSAADSDSVFHQNIYGASNIELGSHKDTLSVTRSPNPQVASSSSEAILAPAGDPSKSLTIDAGNQDEGSGDVLDLSEAGVTKPTSHVLNNGASVVTSGIDYENDHLAGLDNLTFKNFEILTGTDKGDYVVGATGFKRFDLGSGNNVVGNLTGSVLPGDEGKKDNKYVVVNLGRGADTITGGLKGGSEVNLGLADGSVDKVLNVMNDVIINQAGKEDKFYILNGTVLLNGGSRNELSESPWSIGENGVRYGIDKAGELKINYLGSTMYVSNYNNTLKKSQDTGGILLFEYSITFQNLLAPRPPGGELGGWSLFMGYMWKIKFGYSAWKGVDPLVLDLDGKGIVTTATPNVGSNGTGYGVRFDFQGNGFDVPTGWISENDAFVVRDLNGNGQIDSVNELVGQGMNSGFMSLASYDYNNDGKVDADDWKDLNGNGVRDAGEGALDVLRIWRDANGNGVTDAGELTTFSEAGVSSIAVTSSKMDGVFDNGNQILDSGTFIRTDGTVGAADDVTFAIDTYNSQWSPAQKPTITPEIAVLPQLKGHGGLMDLQDAMALDEQAADRTQAVVTLRSGAPAARRETLAEIVTRLGPTLDQPELAALRGAAEPILEAWARTAALVRPASPSPVAANGSETVLNFVVHHAGGPDEPIDYAYRATETLTDANGMAYQVTFWKLGSGAAVKDASGTTIAQPTSAQLLAYAPASGGVWQIEDGEARDLTPPSPHDSVKPFVVADGANPRIADYAYFAPDATGGSWKLASGTAITDASGNAIDRPSYADVLAFQPAAGGTWESFDGANPAFHHGDAGQGLTLLVSKDPAGNETVLDYAYSVTESVVVDGDAKTLTYWKLGSGSSVLDADGHAIAKPTLADVEARPAATASWEHFTGAIPEMSTNLPGQGLTVLVDTASGALAHVLDYAYAVSETVSDPGSALGFQQITYWRLASGAPVLDANGIAIARPTYEQLTAAVPATGGAWRHFDGAMIDTATANPNGQMLILTRSNLDGTSAIVDFASMITETVMIAGPEGVVSPQTRTVWKLGSGNLVTNAAGELLATPTLDQVEQYASSLGATAQLYDGAAFGLKTEAVHQGMTVFIQHVDGQADHVADFAYEVTRPFVVAATADAPAHVADVSYWLLGSGASITDAQGVLIEHPTLDQILASHPSAHGSWEHFDGSYITFLESYMGDKIALDLPGVATTEKFSDYIAAFDNLLGRIDDITVRLAVQGGLKSFFEGVAYDPATDTFAPTTDKQLTPTYQAILTATEGMTATQETAYLGRWRSVLDVVIADYSRGTGGGNNYGFIFSNIAAAYEAVGSQTTLDIAAAAIALGVPTHLVISQAAEVDGTNDADIIYLNAGDQTAAGAGGLDNYVMGANFGHDVVDDIERAGHDTPYEDVMRFTQYSVADLTFVRDGLDLVIVVKNRPDQTVRVTEEFLGKSPGLFGGNFADDTGIAEFVFADGTVWDKIDIANAVREVKPVDGVVMGTPDNDVLDGGPGADYIVHGGDGGDEYVWGRGYGNDTIKDDPSNALDLGINTVNFTPGVTPDDLSFSRVDDSVDIQVHLKGQDGVLTIAGQYDIAETGVYGSFNFDLISDLVFSDGEVMSADEVTTALLDQSETAGDDRIFGFHGNDVLDGRGGNDFLSGGDGNDVYHYDIGYGHDTIDTNIDNLLADHTNTVQFGPGIKASDVTFSRPVGSDDLMITVPGSGGLRVAGQFSYIDTLFGVLRFHYIQSFSFSDGTSLSFGTIANDMLQQQEAQSDIAVIGLPAPTLFDDPHGNATLEGDSFSNRYVFGRGYGHDTVKQNGGDGTVVFGPGIGLTDLQLSLGATARDLNIRIAGTDDVLSLPGVLATYIVSNDVQQFEFADGTSMSLNAMEQVLLAQESAEKKDSIFGFLHDDTIDAGEGGSVLLCAGTGNDTYIYSKASGNDTIDESAGPTYGNGSNNETIQFADIALSEVSMTRFGNDLVIKILPTQHTLTIRNQFDRAYGQIEAFAFSGSALLNYIDIQRIVLDTASRSPAEEIYGYGDPSIITAPTNSAYLAAGGDSTTIVYTSADGNDTIDAENRQGATLVLSDIDQSGVSVGKSAHRTDVVLSLSNGRDITLLDQAGASGLQSIVFADGRSWSAQDILDKITPGLLHDVIGTYGDDTLVAGVGDAYLTGTSGHDDYVYGIDGGNDTIFSGSNSHDTAYDRTLTFTDLNASDVVFRSNGGDVFIDIKATDKTLTILGFYDNFSENTIGSIVFADGTRWSEADVSAAVLLHEEASDLPQISGNRGNDTLIAGSGDKYLSGKTGHDVYVYSMAGGNDTIAAEGSRDPSESRTIDFTDIAFSDVSFKRMPDSNDLIISIKSTGRTLYIPNHFGGGGENRITSFRFMGGTTLSDVDLEALIVQQQSASSSNRIQGDYRSDALVAGSIDRLLIGGGGQDTYVYDRSGGNDTIDDYGSNSQLALTDIASDMVTLSRPNGSSDLVLLVKSTGKAITILRFFANNSGVSSIRFSDGGVFDAATVAAATSSPITGSSANDSFRATIADTSISGGGGSDVYSYDVADGNVTIDNAPSVASGVLKFTGLNAGDLSFLQPEGTSDLRITVKATGHDVVVKSEFDPWNYGTLKSIAFADGTSWNAADLRVHVNKTLTASVDGSSLSGNAGNDTLFGGDGNDLLSGGLGIDTIYGGKGADVMVAGGGQDLFIVDPRNTATEIVGFRPGVDRLKLDPSTFVDYADFLSRSSDVGGSVVSVGRGGGTVTVDGLKLADVKQSDLLFAPVLQAGANALNLSGGPAPGADGLGNFYFETDASSSMTVVDPSGGISRVVMVDIPSYAAAFSRSGNSDDLLVNVLDQGKSVRVIGAFDGSKKDIDVSFSDGVQLDLSEIKRNIIASESSTVFGDVYGYESPDTLQIGTYDPSYASEHVFRGEGGDDRYVYSASSGNDTIDDQGTFGVNSLVFDGISADDVALYHAPDSQDAVFGIRRSGKSLVVKDGLSSDYSSSITNVSFPGEKELQLDAGVRHTVVSYSKSYLVGLGENRKMDLSEADAAFIYFKAGDDIRLNNSVSSDVTLDSALYLADLDRSDVTFSRRDADLLLVVNATGKVITFGDQFSSSNHRGIQTVAFSDGSVMSRDDIKSAAWYRAGPGDASVIAQDGVAILLAGPGNDTLIGGGAGNLGPDTFIYASHDGNLDVEAHVFPWISTANTLKLSDLNAEDVTLSRVNGDLLIAVNETGKVITVPGEFNSIDHDGIQEIVFADGTSINRDAIQSEALYRAGAGDVTVTAQNGDGAILVAGTGNDTLVAGDLGNFGGDTFVYASGNGDLEIDAHVFGFTSISNTLRLTDLDAADVTLSRVNGDLTIAVNATGKLITIPAEFNSADHDGVQAIAFADGTVWNHDQILAAAWYRAGSGDVTETAQDGPAVLVAGPGNDTLVAGGLGNVGPDTFVYASTDGNLEIDAHTYVFNTLSNTLRLTDLNAADLVFARVDNDLRITVSATGKVITVPGDFKMGDHDGGIERIAFADGTFMTRDQITDAAWYRAGAGNVAVTAQNGDGAILVAGAGNDTLVAGDLGNFGGDTFVYASGNGDLAIDAHVFGFTSISNTLRLTDLDAADVTLSRVNGDLTIAVNATGKLITIPAEFNSADHDGVQAIAFADGTVWNHDQILAAAWYRAGSGDVTETAQDGPAVLVAGPGNDTLVAGGLGNVGPDTFVYASTDGNLEIDAHTYVFNTLSNTLRLTDLNAADLVFARVDDDLRITISPTGKVITVPGDFKNGDHDGGIERIAFADGTTMTREQIQTASFSPAPTDPTANYIKGTPGSADHAYDTNGTSGLTYDLGAGDHGVVQTDHDDPLTVIWGKDDGNETFAIGSGNYTNDATLKVTGLAQSDLTFSRVGNDLVLRNVATQKTMTIANEFAADFLGVATIVFDDGTTLDQTRIGRLAYIRGAPASNDHAYDTNGRSGLTYDLGAGDHGIVQTDHDDPLTVIWGKDDGNETFAIGSGNYTNDATLKVTGLAQSDLTFSRVGNDLVLRNVATQKTMTIVNEFAANFLGVATIVFDDGTSVDQTRIGQLAYITGASGSADHAYDTSNTSNLTYDLGVGDHDVVRANHDDPLTVLWGKDDGNEAFTIESNNYSNDAILRITGLAVEDVRFRETVDGALVVTNASSGKAITIANEFNNAWQGVARILFDDGTVLDQARIRQMSLITGTPGSGDHAYDTNGRSGVTYDLGAGDHGYTSVFHDVPVKVIWGAKDGNESFSIEGDNYQNSGTLVLSGLNQADVTFTRNVSGDLVITNNATGKTFSAFNEFNGAWQGFATVLFDDGTKLDQSQISALAYLRGMPGSGDHAYDTGGKPNLTYDLGIGDHGYTSAFHDVPVKVIWGAKDGNESFSIEGDNYQNSGTLVLSGLNQADVTFTRNVSGDLVITNNATGKTFSAFNEFNGAWQGFATIVFQDGTTISQSQIAALATFVGTAGADNITVPSAGTTVDSGLGDDYISVSGNGTDTFLFAKGDGHDTIDNPGSGYARHDTLHLTDIASSEVTLSRSGDGLTVFVPSTGDSVYVKWQFYGTEADYGLDNVRFADGAIWDRDDILAASVAQVSAPASSSLFEVTGNANVALPVGSDVNIQTDAGFSSAAGSDDVFTYAAVDGNVWISDLSGSHDLFRFSDLSSNDVGFSRAYSRTSNDPQGKDVVMTVASTGRQIVLDSQLANGFAGADHVGFDDGVTLNRDQIAAAANQSATISPATFRAGPGYESIDLNQSNGAPVQAVLYADSADDTFATPGGDDTFVYSSASGNLAIQAHGNAARFDMLDLTDLNASDVSFSRNGGDLLIGINATSHAITVAGEFNSNDQDGVQKIAFANGASMNHDQIVAAASQAA